MFPKIKGHSEFRILHFNDVHAKTNNLSQFKTAVDGFDRQFKGLNTLKLAGGDINMDIARGPNALMMKFLNLIGLDASAVGNHDIEGGDYWADTIAFAKPKFKFLSANLNFSRQNPIESKIAKSMIINRNGQKIGVIGVSPLDYGKLTFICPRNDYASVKTLDDTIVAVKKEVKLLEARGINKIFLLAHTGKTSKEGDQYYERLANIGGIDVIIGGHDHLEYKDWLKSERGEPVQVVSVGRAAGKDLTGEDLDSFGILETFFDKNGVLVPERCKHEVKLTKNYAKEQSILDLEERFLHKSTVISTSNIDLTCKNTLTEENLVGSLAADAMLWIINKETKGAKAQIAFVNSGTVRGSIEKGNITMGKIRELLPFVSQTLIKTTLTKKEIINTLNWCAESTTFPKITPGVMQVGGMRYTIEHNNKVKDVHLLNQDGSLGEKIDTQPDDKEYTVAYDSFLMTGVAGLNDLKKDSSCVEDFAYSRQDALIEYLKQHFSNKPIEIKTKRIEVEPKHASIEELAATSSH